MSKKIGGGAGSAGRKQSTGGRAGKVPSQSRKLLKSVKLNDAGYARPPRRPGKGGAKGDRAQY